MTQILNVKSAAIVSINHATGRAFAQNVKAQILVGVGIMGNLRSCYFTGNSMQPQCSALWDRAEAAEARAAEMAGVLDSVFNHLDSPEMRNLECWKNTIIALATTPAAALERARAKDEVVRWARRITNTGVVPWPKALTALDALDQEPST